MHFKKVRRIVPVAQTKHSCERSLLAQALHASGAGRSEVCAKMDAPSCNLEVGHQAQLDSDGTTAMLYPNFDDKIYD